MCATGGTRNRVTTSSCMVGARPDRRSSFLLALTLLACNRAAAPDAASSDAGSDGDHTCWRSLDGSGLPAISSKTAGVEIEGHYFAAAELPSGMGGVLHFDGATWEILALDADRADDLGAPRALWAAAPDLVFALDDTRVWRLDERGATIDLEVEPGTATLTALWGFAADDVWVAGYPAINCFDCNVEPTVDFYHFDGKRWQHEPTELQGAIDALWGATPNDLWAVGSVVLRYDGARWKHVLDLGEESNATRLWGAAANDVWITNTPDPTRHFDGHDWKPIDTGTIRITDICGIEDGTVFALAEGIEPRLLRWNGAAFVAAAITLPSLEPNAQVRLGSFAKRLLVVDGSAYRFDGDYFALWFEPSPRHALGATAIIDSDPPRLLAARGRMLFALSGEDWDPITSLDTLDPEFLAFDLAATSETDAWFVGSAPSASGALVVHWDGASLSPMQLPDQAGLVLHGAQVDDAGNVWVAGVEFPVDDTEDKMGPVRVLRFDGSEWKDMSPDLAKARSVGIAGAGTQVWVATRDGRVAVREGGMWKRHDLKATGESGNVNIDAVAANDVYAVMTNLGDSEAGQLLHYDGTNWTPVAALHDRPVRSVEGSGPDDVWVTGWTADGAVALRFDGHGWLELDATSLEDVPRPIALGDGRAVFNTDVGVWLYDCDGPVKED